MNRIQLEILAHILMFRMTVSSVVSKLHGIDDERLSQELLNDLKEQGWLGSAELTTGTNYFYLMPRAAEPLGLQSVSSGPINGTKKVEAYGTLYYCCMGEVYRPLIDAQTFRTRFKELYRPGLQINHYTEGRKLGYIRVDTQANTTGDTTRVIARCAQDIDKRRRRWLKDQKQSEVCSAFDDLLKTNRFHITLLVAFPQKAQRIETEVNYMRERYFQYQATKRAREKGEFVERNTFRQFQKFEKRDQPPRLPPPIEVHAIPGLIDVMFPKPLAKDVV